MIVTPYCHVLYTKMLQIARRFVSAILRNGGGAGGGGGVGGKGILLLMRTKLLATPWNEVFIGRVQL